MSTQPTCAERIDAHLAGRLEDLHKLWNLLCEDPEAYDDELGNFYEYGLGADYVKPETCEDQPEGYFRYLLSYGGPSDEFRFYVSPHRYGLAPYRVEYRFHDWFDGAGVDLEGDNLAFLREIFDNFWPEPEETIKNA